MARAGSATWPLTVALAAMCGVAHLHVAAVAAVLTPAAHHAGPYLQMPPGCDVDLTAGPPRSAFPPNFTFGFATAAYQVEGIGEGRGRNIWDDWVDTPGKIADGSNADISDDQYHHYPEDVKLMKGLGADAYRLSIAWSRVLPEGTGRVDEKGVAYYNRLINALVAAGIKPVVTLYHWDLPEALYQKDGGHGWVRRSIVEDYVEYADLCFRSFGDRVKMWLTFNEPHDFCYGGYAAGYAAPARCSDRSKCAGGDSRVEAYAAAHNVLRSHSAAVALYRAKYQVAQGGRIGITLNCIYGEPLMEGNPLDRAAAERSMEFMLGWFFDPIAFGRYPLSMQRHVGGRLPPFTAAESAALAGSFDFLGLNFYTARYVAQGLPPFPWRQDPVSDAWVLTTEERNGELIGDATVSSWMWVVPKAVKSMLLWLTRRYGRIPIIITENGIAEANNEALPLQQALCDVRRVKFYQDYLSNAAEAIREGANLQAYFAWSFMDNFEWARGYSERFGVVHVNFTDPSRPRHPKASALWWESFLQGPGGGGGGRSDA